MRLRTAKLTNWERIVHTRSSIKRAIARSPTIWFEDCNAKFPAVGQTWVRAVGARWGCRKQRCGARKPYKLPLMVGLRPRTACSFHPGLLVFGRGLLTRCTDLPALRGAWCPDDRKRRGRICPRLVSYWKWSVRRSLAIGECEMPTEKVVENTGRSTRQSRRSQ